MLRVYPFGSGSLYTASFAVTASYAVSASAIDYVNTASKANTVLYPTSGSAAAKNLCIISYDQYLLLLNNPGTKKEQCSF